MSNREILFRGIDDAAQWVVGSLIQNHDMGWSVIVQYNPNGKDIHHIVKSSTVGQVTGLLDRNGKRIFEGDKISHNGKVYIILNSINWGLVCVEQNKNFGNILHDRIVMQNHNFREFAWIYNTSKYVEVIGTIHD